MNNELIIPLYAFCISLTVIFAQHRFCLDNILIVDLETLVGKTGRVIYQKFVTSIRQCFFDLNYKN